jgi:ubiquinone/menaquinone biosynthesis C-methylase UbiE
MIPYSSAPAFHITATDASVASFLREGEQERNIDWKTVKSFGEEWAKFNTFSDEELDRIGRDYFDIATPDILNKNTVALDVGCGSGRWAHFLSHKIRFIEAIDPSMAVVPAARLLQPFTNVRVTQATVDNLPFPDDSFDLVYSLGVLHHVPDTEDAIGKCYKKIKNGGWFLLYLYYNLDDRSRTYRAVFMLAEVFRSVISRLPGPTKRVVCDILAVIIYWPLARLSRLVYRFSKRAGGGLPLAYYRKTSFQTMRNDCLDRFGTPLEQRFSKKEIEGMLARAGFHAIHFSENAPYWHVIGQKR